MELFAATTRFRETTGDVLDIGPGASPRTVSPLWSTKRQDVNFGVQQGRSYSLLRIHKWSLNKKTIPRTDVARKRFIHLQTTTQ